MKKIQKIEAVIELLGRNQVVGVKTDTVMGLMINGNSLEAVERLYCVKNRPKEKALVAFIADFPDLLKYTEQIPKYAQTLMHHYWPGSVTCIFNLRSDFRNRAFLAEGTTIGIRMPDQPIMRELIRQFTGTLVVTSANKSGYSPCVDEVELEQQFGTDISFWEVDSAAKSDATPPKIASTIVDCTQQEIWQVVREGVVSSKEIKQIIRENKDVL